MDDFFWNSFQKDYPLSNHNHLKNHNFFFCFGIKEEFGADLILEKDL